MERAVPEFFSGLILSTLQTGTQPMGSEITMSQNPKFIVRAAGSFKQKEGCPENL